MPDLWGRFKRSRPAPGVEVIERRDKFNAYVLTETPHIHIHYFTTDQQLAERGWGFVHLVCHECNRAWSVVYRDFGDGEIQGDTGIPALWAERNRFVAEHRAHGGLYAAGGGALLCPPEYDVTDRVEVGATPREGLCCPHPRSSHRSDPRDSIDIRNRCMECEHGSLHMFSPRAPVETDDMPDGWPDRAATRQPFRGMGANIAVEDEARTRHEALKLRPVMSDRLEAARYAVRYTSPDHYGSCPAHPDRVRGRGPCTCGNDAEWKAALDELVAAAREPSSEELERMVEAGWRWLGDMASEDWAALPLDEIARGVLKAAQEVRAA